MPWINQENALEDGQAKVAEIEEFIREHAYPTPVATDNREIATAVTGHHRAVEAIQQHGFFASVGIIAPWDETPQTFYLSRSPDSHYFARIDVLPWTNWIGSVYTRGRDRLLRGSAHSPLLYGAPGHEQERPVGPLANYRFAQGQLLSATLLDAQQAATDSTTDISEDTASPEDRPSPAITLPEIVGTLDADQDENLRANFDGTFFYLGGPGVGKTTIAIHRIAYLINEHAADSTGLRTRYDTSSPKFFTQETMIILVWKDHLVPYLESCLRELGLERVRVQQIDDWISKSLQSHVRFGLRKPHYQVIDDPPEVASIKLAFRRRHLENFLRGNPQLLAPIIQIYSRSLDNINNWRSSRGQPPLKATPPSDFSLAAIAAAFAHLKAVLSRADGQAERLLDNTLTPSDQRLLAKKTRELIQSLLKGVSAGETSANNHIRRNLPEVLFAFFESATATGVAQHAAPSSHRQQFRRHVSEQRSLRQLSKIDRYLLLHIAQIALAGADEGQAAVGLPGGYSHIIVDEAQYYPPIMLSLLHSLTQAPHHSMTIVGDLEQRVASEGGLVSWEDAGITVPQSNVRRLTTNYRWARGVFEFLSAFHSAANLGEVLAEPPVYYSGEGQRPTVAATPSRDEEYEMAAEQILTALGDAGTSDGSIAVILPEDRETESVRLLIDVLARCNVPARWATGQDLQESTDHVIVTGYDHVVGLEFDTVFVLHVDEVFGPQADADRMRRLWVALTRAKKSLRVSGVKAVGLRSIFSAAPAWWNFFGQPALRPYREGDAVGRNDS